MVRPSAAVAAVGLLACGAYHSSPRLDAAMAREAAPGFSGSVLVVKDGRLLLRRGFGWADRARTRRVTPRTRFWIASISKQFTAAAILKLAESGRLSVNDPIARHLAGVSEDKRGITIHHLLTHTAGLRQRYAADGVVDRAAAVRALLAQPLAGAPGEKFTYSNDAYNLLAAIVEIASGESFERFLRTRLLDPAGLSDTGFWGQPGRESVAEILGSNPVDPRPNWGFRGATGMFSTVDDLHRWHAALRDGRVLAPAARDRLLAAHFPVEGGSAGYGWFRSTGVGGRPTLWTRGTEGFGHNAIVMTYPREALVIVAASSSGNRGEVAVTRALAADLAAAVFADGP